MRLALFDDFRLGVVQGDVIVDVTDAFTDVAGSDPQSLMRAVIENWDADAAVLGRAAAASPGVPLSSVRFRPPLPAPRNIDCMAVNYMENGTLTEPPPINAFHKSASSVIGDGDAMVLPDVPATIFEGEAELAVVIGKRAVNVAASEAMSYVFGYTNLIDGSARGLLPAQNSFFQMKSRDTFCPIGPYIVTADEIADPQDLTVRLWNNGELMQDFATSDMAHPIARCIEFLSSIHTLEPGDIVATGTNHRGLNPFMDGDRVELEVEGLGRLHITVSDPLQRTWARETRRQRQEADKPGPTPQIGGKYASADQ